MSLALAFTNLFSNNSFLGERQRQRYVSEPVNSHDEEQQQQQPPVNVDNDEETANAATPTPTGAITTALSLRENNSTAATAAPVENNNNTSSSTTAVAADNTAVNMVEVTHVMNSNGDVVDDEEEEDDPFMAVAAALRRRSSTAITLEDDDDDDGLLEDEHDNSSTRATAVDYNNTYYNNMTLAELQEERELARRRSSACSMLAIFILFRLWISCLQQGDVTLFLLCLLGTSWTVRWIRYNREREEELDYRMEQYIQQQQNAQNGENNGTATTTTTRSALRNGAGGGIIVDRNELRMLSFQAQLSLAIMESQRHMMETGGYGRDDHPTTPGVSEQAKKYWKRFAYQSPPPAVEATAQLDKKAKKTAAAGHGDDNNGSKLYGSMSPNPTKDKLSEYDQDDVDDSELPHCSICLGDYEDGEALVQLPCGHLYHDSCIASWTASHTKCPLCNFDLESVVVNDADAAAASNHKRQQHQHRNNNNNSDSIV